MADTKNTTNSVRLYAKGKVLGYQRSHRAQQPQTSLLRIEGVTSRTDTQFYLGKRVAYVYRAERAREKRGTFRTGKSKVRVIWGRVTRPHGSTGAVRAKFRVNLPPSSFGASCRVMLYPSRI